MRLLSGMVSPDFGRAEPLPSSLRMRAAPAEAGSCEVRLAHWSVTMAIPHFINDDKAEMRGIKPGWYAIEDDGNLSSGPFASHDRCLTRITEPTSDSTPSGLPPRLK